jgi:transcription antitermination factor NusG
MAEGRLDPSPLWYAVRTRANFSKKVQEILNAAEIDNYLPVYREEVRWSDRTKVVERALFPGYLFTRLVDPLPLLQIFGVVQILGSNLKPTPIPDEQIAAVRQVCESLKKVSPCPYVAGENVAIHSGPLAGVVGVIVRTHGELRVVVRIEILSRAVSVEIESRDLEKTA